MPSNPLSFLFVEIRCLSSIVLPVGLSSQLAQTRTLTFVPLQLHQQILDHFVLQLDIHVSHILKVAPFKIDDDNRVILLNQYILLTNVAMHNPQLVNRVERLDNIFGDDTVDVLCGELMSLISLDRNIEGLPEYVQ